jgi:hypothetical protein
LCVFPRKIKIAARVFGNLIERSVEVKELELALHSLTITLAVSRAAFGGSTTKLFDAFHLSILGVLILRLLKVWSWWRRIRI